MICPICRIEDKASWENIDRFRDKPAGMAIHECGFVSYPGLGDTKEFYKTGYRDYPRHGTYTSGLLKLKYHEAFLGEYLASGMVRSGDNVLDIGAGFGMFLDWFKKKIPGVRRYGTELTPGFVANAWEEYGLTLNDEPDWSKKYHFISLYQVAEHLPDVHLLLEKCMASISHGAARPGKLYFSVPTWFGSLSHSGNPGEFSLEKYYATPHINVWTVWHVEKMLRDCGFGFSMENHVLYGSTYLCGWAYDDVQSKFPNKGEVLQRAASIKLASDYFRAGDFSKAVEEWPDFPSAWIRLIDESKSRKDKQEVVSIAESSVASCCRDLTVMAIAGAAMYTAGEKEKGISVVNRALSLFPHHQVACLVKAEMLADQGRTREARDLYRDVSRVSVFSTELRETIYKLNSLMHEVHK